MNRARACPSCGATLAQGQTAHGIHFACPECKGLQLGLSVLQKLREAEAVQQLWVKARREGRPGPRPCAECRTGMLVVETPPDHGGIEVDVCPRCYVVWLDPGELEKLPEKPRAQAELEQRAERRREERERDERRRKDQEVDRMTAYARATPEETIIEAFIDLLFWQK